METDYAPRRDWRGLLEELRAPTESADASLEHRARARRECANPFDVVIIGAGINGAASAAALVEYGMARSGDRGRPPRVLLLDRGDIAGETSMASGNAIWGGFKYLANGHVKMVAKSCRQRTRLCRLAPHVVQLTEYAMPCYREDPYGMALRGAGSLAYYALAGGPTAVPFPRYYPSAGAMRNKDPRLRTEGLRGGIGYHEAELTTSDAHFTLQFVLSALSLGGFVLTYAEVKEIDASADGFVLQCHDRIEGDTFGVQAKKLVNAAGPWAEHINRMAGVRETRHTLALRRGTFLVAHAGAVTPAGVQAPEHFLTYFCHGEDRPFFLYPWGPRVIIGTTDIEHPEEALDAISPSREEIDFIVNQVDSRLREPAVPLREGVVGVRAGVRPLAVVKKRAASAADRDALSLSRDHKLDVCMNGRYVAIYGGKLTPCRQLAAEVVQALTGRGSPAPLSEFYGAPPGWSLERMVRTLGQAAEGVDVEPTTIADSTRQFGAYANGVIRILRADSTLGERPYPDLPYSWADLVLNVRNRMVLTLDDLLRRRTNIEQWTAGGGFGSNDEHAGTVRAIAELVCAATGRDPQREVEVYRQGVERRQAPGLLTRT